MNEKYSKGDEISGVAKMEASLEKLCSLSKDDKTEKAMLRSRIDEQSRLIMMLKQRADEEINRVKTLERTNKELSDRRDDLEARWRQELNTSNMLDKRFHELASNHEEMIKIKDEYKRGNVKLRAENARLKEENGRMFNAALDEKTRELQEIKIAMSAQCEKYNDLDIRFRELQNNLHDKEVLYQTSLTDVNDSYRTDVSAMNSTISDLNERLKGVTQELDSSRELRKTHGQEIDERLHQMTKEKDEMLQLAMERGKLVNKEQDANKALRNRITEMEKAVKTMEDKFEREASAVNVNLQVKKLREQIELGDLEYQEMEQMFNGYKKHASSLLVKERELNQTLRHLST